MVQTGMMFGAQFLAAARHRFQPIAQSVAIDQGQSQGHDGGESKDRRRGRGQKCLVEEDIEDADIEHGLPSNV